MTEFIRVFVTPKRCMQRLGLLKPLLVRASETATSSTSNIGKELINLVTQRVHVKMNYNVENYIKRILGEARAINLYSQDSLLKKEEITDRRIVLELQDFYLSDPNLPSSRGKLVEDDWSKFPILALNLNLIKRQSYSIQVRGKAFLSLMTEDEKLAFRHFSQKTFDIKVNPLALSLPQRILLLFSFIECDGDVLSRLCEKLLLFTDDFTDREAGEYLPEIYREIAKIFKAKIRTGEDLIRLQKMSETAKSIEKWIKNKPTGGKDNLTHNITPRLEPLVDLGLLIKSDPFSYKYKIGESTKKFFESLLSSQDIDHFLNLSFFAAVNNLYDIGAVHSVEQNVLLPSLQMAFKTIKSQLGYAPILELSILASIYSIKEYKTYFEINESLEFLQSIQKKYPNLIRFNVDRWGVLTFVKFDPEISDILPGDKKLGDF